MKELFSLGKLYVSDFLKPDEQPRCAQVEMKLMLDENGAVRLEKMAPKDSMWGKYWYRSSISSTMRQQLKDVVDSALSVFKLNDGDVWCDVAGNDGYMMSQVPSNIIRINIDPADDTFKVESEKHCDLVIQDYFSAEAFGKSKFGDKKVNVISCVSMFYDLEEPGKFLDDIYKVLEQDGLFILQMSYTPLMLSQLEFSNICHEHCYYYSFFNIKNLLYKHGFKVMDVQLNNTNAGSFRMHIMKDVGNKNKYASQTYRDVCDFRMESLLSHERTLQLDEVHTWRNFHDRIIKLKEKTLSFIRQAKKEGKTIMAYGASTKFNTLLQTFGITSEMIDAIAERSPAKYGMRAIGSNIPIISEHEMRSAQPDYLIIGPFQFLSEFIEREKEYLQKGGKFVVLMPKFEIIGS